MSDDSTRISPTAWYTGYVWFRNGLSHPALVQPGGRLLYWLLQPLFWLGAPLVGGVTLERMLLQRHRIIDRLLIDAIEAGEVTQVLEIAAGFTGRGLRLCRAYPHLRYVESDLPHQLAAKVAAVEGIAPDNLSFRTLDIFADDARSLEAALADFDPASGVAVITEGLINYFDTDTVRGLWGRLARGMAAFPQGRYLADVRLDEVRTRFVLVRLFMSALGAFARGKVHTHFDGRQGAHAAAQEAGFAASTLHSATDWADRLDVFPGRKGDILLVFDART